MAASVSLWVIVSPHSIFTSVQSVACWHQQPSSGGRHSSGPFAPFDRLAPLVTAIRWSGPPSSWRTAPSYQHSKPIRRSRGRSSAVPWTLNTGQFTIPAMLAGMDAPVSTSLIQTDSGQAEQESFFTRDERATLADVSDMTQKRSDNYEKAGLGPEIRSGAISGAEAERRARDPDTPRPPSRVQQLEMQVEAQALVV